MAKTVYTAQATVTGGRSEGHGASSDGQLDVQLRLPKEMGGEGDGTNPEQLFAVGYAACFEGALGVASRRAHVDPGEVSIDCGVSMTPNGEGGFVLSVALDVSLPEITDDAVATKLVTDAHAVCPYSNATRGNIDVALTANGTTIS